MYMYYLLGYRILEKNNDVYDRISQMFATNDRTGRRTSTATVQWKNQALKRNDHFGKSIIFDDMERDILHEVSSKL